ncbi:MAG: putative membrane metal-binding protein, partial [bacterium]
RKNKTFFKLSKSKNIMTSRNYIIYKKSLTGDNSPLPKKIQEAFQKYGLYHLLTPSGLHLSSLFFLKILPGVIQVLFLLAVLAIILPMNSYLSLERILIFKTLFHFNTFSGFKLDQESMLFLTIIVSILIGNFHQSPMSFMFSILFWGAILIYKENKLQTLLFLNISQHLIGTLLDQPVNLVSLVINPLYTFSFVTMFPLFLINQLLGELAFLTVIINLFLEFWLNSLLVVLDNDFIGAMRFNLYPLMLISIMAHYKRYKVMLIFICLLAGDISSPQLKSNSHRKDIINIGHGSEILNVSRKMGQDTRYTFIDQKCVFSTSRFFCKKKPSKYGGPIF